jgi:chemotaxis protein methyltransferase CheR
MTPTSLASAAAEISAEDQRFLGDLIRRESGRRIVVSSDPIVARRLAAVAMTLGFADLRTLLAQLRHSEAPSTAKSVCDALASGEQTFFRDAAGFDAIRATLLPRAVARARAEGRSVRIWSAACATGQEAYSLAMLVDDATHESAGTPVEILASDYSAPTVARAEAGVFSRFDVQRGLSSAMLVRHFVEADDDYRASDTLRARIQFAEQNLLASLTIDGSFDIILMRHVLMYFDKPIKRDIVGRVVERLAAGGALILGTGENLRGLGDSVRRDRSCGAPVYGSAAETADAPAFAVVGV